MGSSPTCAHLMPPMLKHKSTVEDMQFQYRGNAWRWYDESLRRAIAMPGSTKQWGAPDWSRYMEAIHRDGLFNKVSGEANHSNSFRPYSPKHNSNPSNNRGSTSPGFPKGYCYTFCRGSKCTRFTCSHKHVCYHCQGHHFPSACQQNYNAPCVSSVDSQ
jgi:hypothetical protein